MSQARLWVSFKRLRRFVALLLLFYIGESAAEFGTKIGGFGCDVDGLGGFATHPAIEFLGRSQHATAFAGDGHAGLGPALRGRYG